MSDEHDPEATLREWKESMAAEHEAAISDPDPDERHEVEAVVQHSERVRYGFADGDLIERERERVEADDPELFSCVCGVRGMTREEARDHLAAAESQS